MTEATSIPIGEFPLNAKGEILRISIDDFAGRKVFNLRKWFKAETGEFRPGKGGVAFMVSHLPKLATIIEQAMQRAVADGLIEVLGAPSMIDPPFAVPADKPGNGSAGR